MKINLFFMGVGTILLNSCLLACSGTNNGTDNSIGIDSATSTTDHETARQTAEEAAEKAISQAFELAATDTTADSNTDEVSKEASTEDDKDGNDDDKADISHRYQYKVRGEKYHVFSNADSFQEIGMASWYGPGFHGKKTANGETYDMYEMTAAHKTLPLGSLVKVRRLDSGDEIIVRINDRGPFHGGRIIDLSKAAAQTLGMIKEGAVQVHIKAIEE